MSRCTEQILPLNLALKLALKTQGEMHVMSNNATYQIQYLMAPMVAVALSQSELIFLKRHLNTTKM